MSLTKEYFWNFPLIAGYRRSFRGGGRKSQENISQQIWWSWTSKLFWTWEMFIIQCGVLIVLQVQKLCVVASLELFPSFKNPSILIGVDGKVIIKFHGTKLLFYYFNCILGNLSLHGYRGLRI